MTVRLLLATGAGGDTVFERAETDDGEEIGEGEENAEGSGSSDESNEGRAVL